MILIDTSLLIAHVRKPDKTQTVFYQLTKQEELAIAMMTAFEFLIGKNASNASLIDSLLANLEILVWDKTCMEISTQIYRDLKQQSQLIETPDIIIAATAIAHQIPLATRNQRHFERIKDLQLFDISGL
ncbi:MAG: type II toxin-antitoxin system VapC family toxin [Bacteroidia bacterium]|nr:type II toxin-antitoxin system VapC family toxin [Bacteroidia bacterium]